MAVVGVLSAILAIDAGQPSKHRAPLQARGYLTDEDVFPRCLVRVLLDANVHVSAVATREVSADVLRLILADAS